MLNLSGKVESTTAVAGTRVATQVTASMLRWTSEPNRTNTMFTTNGGQSGTYVSDHERFIHYVDFTSSPVWIDKSGSPKTWGRGCLITPQNCISAAHFAHVVGEAIVFRGADGVLYERTVASVDTSIGYDVAISELSSALPTAVSFAKMLPADADDWISSGDLTAELPIVLIDQDLKLITKQWTGYDTGLYDNKYIVTANEDDLPGSQYTKTLIAGDSGSANYIILNGEAVLISCNHLITAGPAYHLLRTEIDAVLAALGGAYTATTSFSLAGFST